MPAPSKANAKSNVGSKAKMAKVTPKVEAKNDQVSEAPVPATGSQTRKKKAVRKGQTDEEDPENIQSRLSASAVNKRKRAAAALKSEDDPHELPHNMGKQSSPKEVRVKHEDEEKMEPPAKNGSPTKPALKKRKLQDTNCMVEAAVAIDAPTDTPKSKTKKVEHFPCGDPYPDWPHPTSDECQVVHDLLKDAFPSDQHSRFVQPDTVPPPSEFVAGCGAVPTILDAMLRTLLSAATSKRNSSSAFQGLVKRFGIQQSGPCKGSVDWMAIRHATLSDVFEAIKTGGLARNKSKNIKAILDMVYQENEERCEAHAKVIENDDPSAAPEGADPKNRAQMKGEIALFEQGILTLDYYHLLSKDDALMAMQRFPGIGVKTAACVALFCMQKPCFAVDTHVFRLCRYLGWVPPKDEKVAHGEKKKRPEVNEVNTFKHCEVRVPDHLKYGLHQLFWDHGNRCGRCRAITGETSEGWADANCPIEHLVKRYGEKKGGTAGPVKIAGKVKKGKGGKKWESDDDDDVEESADDTDEDTGLGEDEEDYSPAKSRKTNTPQRGKAIREARATTAGRANGTRAKETPKFDEKSTSGKAKKAATGKRRSR